MSRAIREFVKSRSITRLCHFTPSRNLGHIWAGDLGVLATSTLMDDEAAVLNPTDRERRDGHLGHISCSVQFPNSWYFRQARGKEKLFLDWVILFIEPRYLWEPGAKFCPRNAAANHGRDIREGFEGLVALYSEAVAGACGKTYKRSRYHLPSCPTDDQAEVLIPNPIRRESILGVAVRTAEQARNERSRFRIQGVPSPRFWIAPTLFDANRLSAAIREGNVPSEEEFDEEIADG